MEILKRNWKIKLLSLFISIFLWSFIITNENPTVTSRLTAVPILFENTDALDKKGLIISDKLQRQMDISISGRRNSIINLTNQHVRVSADFSDASEGVQKVKLRYSMPEGIEVVNAEKTIDVNIEKIISKDFVVNLEAQGAMMADYILES